MKRLILMALMAVPVFAVFIFLASLVPGFDKVDLKVTGNAWFALFGTMFVTYFGLKTVGHSLSEFLGSKVMSFVGRVAGFAVVLPLSFIVANMIYPENVTIAEPLAAFAIAVAMGLASATSDELESRFLPKPVRS